MYMIGFQAALSQGRGPGSWLAFLEPADLVSLALVHPACARWVRALLRSQIMDPVFQQLYVKVFRPSAVLHPELLPPPRAALFAVLQQATVPAAQVSPLSQPVEQLRMRRAAAEHLHMQHLAEVWSHFCNAGSGQCQWTGWMRLEFYPYLAPDGSWPDREHDGHAWTHQNVIDSIHDYLLWRGLVAPANLEMEAAFRSTQTWLRWHLKQCRGGNLDPSQKLRQLLRKYAALFPQLSDEKAAEDVRLDADDLAGVRFFCVPFLFLAAASLKQPNL